MTYKRPLSTITHFYAYVHILKYPRLERGIPRKIKLRNQHEFHRVSYSFGR